MLFIKFSHFFYCFTLLTFIPAYYFCYGQLCGRPEVQPRLDQQKTVGRHIKKHNRNKRIVNGKPAAPHSWPWMTFLIYPISDGAYICGGSLIPGNNPDESDLIITAAHCFNKRVNLQRQRFTAVLGLDNFKNPLVDNSTKSVRIVKAEYLHSAIFEDIALLKLARPIKYNSDIQPICLPTQGQQPSNPENCYATGFGRVKKNTGRLGYKLQQVRMPVIPMSTCSKENVWGILFRTDEKKLFCAGYLDGSKNVCEGDSGGPLVCLEDDHWVLYGLASFVAASRPFNRDTKCAIKNKPGVFVNVSNYANWITEKINALES